MCVIIKKSAHNYYVYIGLKEKWPSIMHRIMSKDTRSFDVLRIYPFKMKTVVSILPRVPKKGCNNLLNV